MSRRSTTPFSIKLLTLSVALIVCGYVTAFFPTAQTAGWWIMAAGVVLNAVAALALGALKGNSARPTSRVILIALVGTGAALGAGFAIALTQSTVSTSTSLLWGLPRPTALLLTIVGLMPLFVLPLVYAFTFSTHVLTDVDLERIVAASPGSGRKTVSR